jgi:hypothetical protein
MPLLRNKLCAFNQQSLKQKLYMFKTEQAEPSGLRKSLLERAKGCRLPLGSIIVISGDSGEIWGSTPPAPR